MTRSSLARCSFARAAIFLWFGLVPTEKVGAEQAHVEEISFDQALALGKETPAVSEPQDMLQAREDGDRKMRGTAEATTLSFMPGALVWPREGKGFEMQANITQGWSLGDLGGARRDSAKKERAALAATVRARALRARLEAARRWIDLASLALVIEACDARIAAAEEMLERRKRALSTGVGTVQPLIESRANLAQLRHQRLGLEGDEFAAAIQLSVAVGREPTQGRLQTAGNLPEPLLPDEAEIRKRIEDIDAAPDVVVERLHETAARARAIEASAQYAPVLTLGAQGERGALGSWVVYGVTGLSYRGPGQSRRLTSVAEASAAGATANTAAAKLNARAELEDALHELKHTATVRELLEQDTLPALRQLVDSRTRAVKLGEEPYFALLEARDRELAAVEAAHRARGAHAWARVHMWLLLAELAQPRSEP